MQTLEERKKLLRERIAELSKDLQYHDNAAKGLRERLRDLDDSVRAIVEQQQREAESKKKGSNKQ